ncbi:MAG: LysR family transcriptional regulator [Chromatiales bacterium]|jgi:DNA-binding transcriptional LysR family regulator
MKNQQSLLDDRLVFITVVRHGSFTGAARELELTTAAVSRRVKALESRMGVRLLNRTTRRLSLTDAGQQYYEDMSRLLLELQQTEERIAGLATEPTGFLRMTAPLSFGMRYLGKLIASFHAQYPAIRIELTLDDTLRDIVSSGFDAAIRIGRLQDSALVARRLGGFRQLVCASPGYLARHGEPRIPQELVDHECLHYTNLESPRDWLFEVDGKPFRVRTSGSFGANNGDVLCDAAVHGMGIVHLPEFIADRYLHDGRLVSILEDYVDKAPLEMFALYPTRSFMPAALKLFLQALSESCSSEQGSSASQTGLSISK